MEMFDFFNSICGGYVRCPKCEFNNKTCYCDLEEFRRILLKLSIYGE